MLEDSQCSNDLTFTVTTK